MDANAALQKFFQPGASLTIERIGPAPQESRPLFRWLRTGLLGAAMLGRAGQAMAWQLPWAQSEPLFSKAGVIDIKPFLLLCKEIVQQDATQFQAQDPEFAARPQETLRQAWTTIQSDPLYAIRTPGALCNQAS